MKKLMFLVVTCLAFVSALSFAGNPRVNCDDDISSDPTKLAGTQVQASDSRVRGFQKAIKESVRSSSNYTQINKTIEKLFSQNDFTTDEFVSVSLYLINGTTHYVGSYSVAYDSVLSAFEIIRKASLSYPLTEGQAELIRNAMLDRPRSLKDFLDNFLESWENTERAKLLAIASGPIGKAGYLPRPKVYPETYGGFFADYKNRVSLVGKKDEINRILFEMLTEYSTKLSPAEFTSICLNLINWKVVFYVNRPYGAAWGELDSMRIVEGFELIRQATLKVALSAEEVTQIKTAMATRPNGIREIVMSPMSPFLESWKNGRTELGKVLQRPFGLTVQTL